MNLIPSIRGLGNLPLRVPHEEIETRGEEGTQVQRREGEKEIERKKLLEFLLCPLQVSYVLFILLGLRITANRKWLSMGPPL